MRRRRVKAELTGIDDPVLRSEDDKGISLRQLADVVADGQRTGRGLVRRAARSLARPPAGDGPTGDAVVLSRRVRPQAVPARATRIRRSAAIEVCLATLSDLGFDLAGDSNIRTDLEDRPQKSPRACVIASDPPSVVHLITRAQGGLPDYRSFLHEAGHALHYAGCDPELPYAFRALSRDNALTEIYAFLIESLSREPGWHEHHFDLSPKEAARTRRRRSSSTRTSSAATRRSSSSSSTSGRGSPRTAARRRATPTG